MSDWFIATDRPLEIVNLATDARISVVQSEAIYRETEAPTETHSVVHNTAQTCDREFFRGTEEECVNCLARIANRLGAWNI